LDGAPANEAKGSSTMRRWVAASIFVFALVELSSGFVHSSSRRHASVDPAAVTYLSPTRTQALQASPSPIFSILSSPLSSLIILAGIVLVHESGHYLAARTFGIEVEEFSIGVGPKLFGFKAFGDEFNLRAIPLGGYVRFPENYNSTLVREQEQAAFQAARAFDVQQESDLKYKVVNALTFGSLDDLRRKKEKQRRAKLREEVASDSEGQQWWSRWRGRRTAVVKEENEILDIEDVKIDYYDDPKLLQNRPWFERAVVLSGGIVFNLMLSFFIYFGEISYGPGVPRPIFAPGALITSTPRSEAAASGLLRKGDVIVAVNGALVSRSESPLPGEAQKSISNLVSKIRATPDGETLHLTVFHQGESSPTQIDVRPKRVNEGPQTIGVLLSPNFLQSEVVRADSVWDGGLKAAVYVGDLTRETARGLVSIVADVAKGKGTGNQISGPIGLIKTGSEVVATRDWSSVLTFAAAISINLAVVNAFPLPALDGGQLLFVLSEAVSGRKVDQRLQEGITGATLLFLLLATFGAAFSDLESIFGR
jgi:membrane-associated protease RseP (regulator of RpoE activity)